MPAERSRRLLLGRTPVRTVLAAVAILLLLAVCAAAAAPRAEAATTAQKFKALQKAVKQLQTLTRAQQSKITAQQSQITTLQDQLAAAEPVLELAPYVDVTQEPLNGVAGPNVMFTGVNLHLRDGSGSTSDGVESGGTLTGLGNLIIGYDEVPAGARSRAGSHNVVMGSGNAFSSYGGFVGGSNNTISARFASIFTGSYGIASGWFGAISTGSHSESTGMYASVTGGNNCRAYSAFASVTGGESNIASGVGSSISGGDSITNAVEDGWSGGSLHSP